MILEVKHKTEKQPNQVSSYTQMVTTTEVKCDRVRAEDNLTMFEEAGDSGSYKPVFIINSNNLIKAERKNE